MTLKILHLSDIHFYSFGENEHLDLDYDLRNELESDLRQLMSNAQPVDVLLIGGDIGFSGKKEEYEKASVWIREICSITGCKEENVLMVPGNHDIKRSSISPLLKRSQEILKKATSQNEINKEVRFFLSDKSAYNLLTAPFEDYLDFAQKYGSIPQDKYLYWEKDFPIENITLRVRGINSAFASNETDDENSSKVALSEYQTILKREDNIIYLILCHHPPQWLCDGEDVDRALCARANIHLYGHMHDSKLSFENNVLKVYAGAVHPERNNGEWKPTYNILEIENTPTSNYLEIKVWIREWNSVQMQFIPHEEYGFDYKSHRIEIQSNKSSHVATMDTPEDNSLHNNVEEIIEMIDTKKFNPKRKLAYMYLSLPYHMQVEIATNLDLIEDTDKGLSDSEKIQNYFSRAFEQEKQAEMWDLIKKMKPEIVTDINPYKEK